MHENQSHMQVVFSLFLSFGDGGDEDDGWRPYGWLSGSTSLVWAGKKRSSKWHAYQHMHIYHEPHTLIFFSDIDVWLCPCNIDGGPNAWWSTDDNILRPARLTVDPHSPVEKSGCWSTGRAATAKGDRHGANTAFALLPKVRLEGSHIHTVATVSIMVVQW